MKILAVCGILLGLATLSPATDSPGAAAWALGLILALAFAGQQVVTSFGLPPVLGWLAAGVILGSGGLNVVRPFDSQTLHLVQLFAGVWLGLQVGLSASWPRANRSWRLPTIVTFSTLLALLLTAAAVLLVLRLPANEAMLIGVVVCLWGPFLLSSMGRSDEAVLVSLMGSGISLLLLSVTFLALPFGGALPSLGAHIVARLWISVAVGAAAAELLWQLKLLNRRTCAVVALTAIAVGASLFVQMLDLYALPCGLAAGIVLALHDGEASRLRHQFEPGRQLSAMTFFAFAAAAVDTERIWWPPAEGVLQIIALALAALVLLRVIGPSAWYPLPAAAGDFTRRDSWLLLPKGALLFELTFRPRGSLLDLASPGAARLLEQVILADLVLYGVLLAAIAGVADRFLDRRQQLDAAVGTASEKEPQ